MAEVTKVSRHGDMKLSKMELGVALQVCGESHEDDCQCCLTAVQLVASQMEDDACEPKHN